eukprot:2717627-Rhodomonas_salina.2
MCIRDRLLFIRPPPPPPSPPAQRFLSALRVCSHLLYSKPRSDQSAPDRDSPPHCQPPSSLRPRPTAVPSEHNGPDDFRRHVGWQLDFAFLFVVDVAQQCSVLLVCGGRELALARHAFPNCPLAKAHPSLTKGPGTHISADQTMIDVGPLVSRKAQFVPAFSKILGAGFTCHRARTADGGGEEPEGDALEECWATPGKAEVYVDAQQRLCREGSARHVLFESNYHDDPTPSAA